MEMKKKTSTTKPKARQRQFKCALTFKSVAKRDFDV